MGLDMYLSKKIFIGANFEHLNVKGSIHITKNGREVPINFNRVSSITEEVMYWRKANQIHNWFVDNVQDGNDDCKEYTVSREDLEELLSVCKEVKEDNSKAKDLLPVAEGFFFGSYEYDEWYFQQIDYTIEELTKLLEEVDKNNCDVDFVYQSSW